MGQELQAKQAEGQQLMSKAQGEAQGRRFPEDAQPDHRGHHGKISADVARKKGGTLVYDKGTLVYSDPAYDITSDVLAEVAKFSKPTATK